MPHLHGDKIHNDFSYFNNTCNTVMLMHCKQLKGELQIIRHREKTVRDLFFTTVSKFKQPIELFFNWLNEKTEFQRALKVIVTKDLLVHALG